MPHLVQYDEAMHLSSEHDEFQRGVSMQIQTIVHDAKAVCIVQVAEKEVQAL
jgi:hypothetical protein